MTAFNEAVLCQFIPIRFTAVQCNACQIDWTLGTQSSDIVQGVSKKNHHLSELRTKL